MNNKLFGYIVGGIAVLALVLSVTNHKTVVQPVQTQFGGTSPDIASPYVTVNGVTQWWARGSINQASTTMCSLQAPLATSTLVYSSLTLTTGTTTTLIIDEGRALSFAATTTKIGGTMSLNGGTLGTLIASSTPSAPDGAIVFPSATASTTDALGNPTNAYINKNYLNWIYALQAGTMGATNTMAGTCEAEWIQNN